MPRGSAPPAPPNTWTQELFERLERIETKLNKLDTIENTVVLLGSRVDTLETEIQRKVNDIETGLDFVS